MTAIAENLGVVPAEAIAAEPPQQLGRMALKASGWILASAPLWGAGAVAGVEMAPPAHVQLAPDVDVSAHLNIGGNTIHMYAPNIGNARGPDSTHVGRKHLGIDVGIEATNLLKTTSNGSIGVEDVKAFGPMFADSRPEIEKVVTAEKNQLADWAGGGAALTLLAESGLLIGSRIYRRQQDKETADVRAGNERILKPFIRLGKGAVGASALALLGNSAYVYAAPNHDQQIAADPILNDTPFQGWEISGNIEGPLNQAAPVLIEKISQIRGFASTAIANATKEVNSKLMVRGPHDKILLHVDDLQGRLIMMWLSGAVAKDAKVDGIINSGDYALTGTSYDAFLVNAMRDRAGSKMPIENSLGAHDNDTVAQLELKAHEMVANGQVQHFAGLNVLGVNVPEHAIFLGGQMEHLGDKSLEQVAMEAAQKTCSQHVQIVFTHDKEMGRIIAQYGCAKLVDDGRSYDTLGPTQFVLPDGNIATEATSGSGGALESADGPSIGLPTNPAVITFQKYNTLTGEPVSYQVLTINPDASAELSPEIGMAVPYAEYLKTGRTQRDDASQQNTHTQAAVKGSGVTAAKQLSRRR